MEPTREPPSVGTRTAAGPRAWASTAFITLLVGNQLGIWIAILTPANVTLAVRIGQIAPNDRASALSVVAALGALSALLGTPLFGRLSDRTATRFGRRRPWIIGGVLGTFAALMLVATAPTVLLAGVGWCLAQASISAAFAATTAMVPDKVPVEQRGFVSGLLGLTIPAATVIGTGFAQLFPVESIWIFVVPTAIGLFLCAAFVTTIRDTDQPASDVPRFSWTELARSYWVNPIRFPDFAWTFLSRFLVYMGYAMLLTYQVYYLQEHLGRGAQETTTLVFYVMVAMGIASLVTAVPGGRWSDRLIRRKPFVFGSAAIMAVGLLGVSLAQSFTTFLIMATIVGLGKGLFLGVDLALVSQVLPNPQDTAKDMGVFNIASTLPQSFAPFLAPFILAIGSATTSNYMMLYLFAAGFVLLGAATIYLVRGAR